MGIEITKDKVLYRLNGEDKEIFSKYIEMHKSLRETLNCLIPESENYSTTSCRNIKDSILSGKKPLTYSQWIRVLQKIEPTILAGDVQFMMPIELVSDYKDAPNEDFDEICYLEFGTWGAEIAAVLIDPKTTIENTSIGMLLEEQKNRKHSQPNQ